MTFGIRRLFKFLSLTKLLSTHLILFSASSLVLAKPITIIELKSQFRENIEAGRNDLAGELLLQYHNEQAQVGREPERTLREVIDIVSEEIESDGLALHEHVRKAELVLDSAFLKKVRAFGFYLKHVQVFDSDKRVIMMNAFLNDSSVLANRKALLVDAVIQLCLDSESVYLSLYLDDQTRLEFTDRIFQWSEYLDQRALGLTGLMKLAKFLSFNITTVERIQKGLFESSFQHLSIGAMDQSNSSESMAKKRPTKENNLLRLLAHLFIELRGAETALYVAANDELAHPKIVSQVIGSEIVEIMIRKPADFFARAGYSEASRLSVLDQLIAVLDHESWHRNFTGILLAVLKPRRAFKAATKDLRDDILSITHKEIDWLRDQILFKFLDGNQSPDVWLRHLEVLAFTEIVEPNAIFVSGTMSADKGLAAEALLSTTMRFDHKLAFRLSRFAALLGASLTSSADELFSILDRVLTRSFPGNDLNLKSLVKVFEGLMFVLPEKYREKLLKMSLAKLETMVATDENQMRMFDALCILCQHILNKDRRLRKNNEFKVHPQFESRFELVVKEFYKIYGDTGVAPESLLYEPFKGCMIRFNAKIAAWRLSFGHRNGLSTK